MSEKPKKIAVYFKNHKIARFDEDRVAFANAFDRQGMKEILAGNALVNWNNVCFVQLWEPKEEDPLNDPE